MDWNGIHDEIKKISASNQNTREEAESGEEAGAAPEIPAKQWYQILDTLSRNDELLEAILRQLKKMETLIPSPATPPEYPVIPPGIEPKLDVIAVQSIRTKELLEGFSFLNGQSVVAAPGTRMEVISTVKTYLIIVRAHLTNVGDVYVGGSGVTAGTGFILNPGAAVVLQTDCLKKSIWMDAANANDGVSWIALVD